MSAPGFSVAAILAIASYSTVLAGGSSDGAGGGPNSPVFNLDHTALEKNIAAIFNKVAHSSATTKRSVPAYEARVSASTSLSTLASPLTTATRTTSTARTSTTAGEAAGARRTTTMTAAPLARHALPRVTASPTFRDLPSYAPPSRAPFTPPLPPDYSNPFADKPTLRGTNSESHTGPRRPIPPPSLTPAHERIPIRPPDLVENSSQSFEKPAGRNKLGLNTPSKEQKIAEPGGDAERRDNASEFVPTLHYPSISRILSGSNGRKQDIPEILLKPLATKSPLANVPSASTTERTTTLATTPGSTTTDAAAAAAAAARPITRATIFNLPNTRRRENEDGADDDDDDDGGDGGGAVAAKTDDTEIVDAEKLPYPQPQPPAPSKRPAEGNRNVPRVDAHPLESTWRVAWSLHVYVAAIMFTLMALYSIYKIVRFNEATNLLGQSYFLTVHLLLTSVCTLRCFHLFYDAYNLGKSLPEPLSRVLMYLPEPLLSSAFATMVLYLAKCSEAPSLEGRFVSPGGLGLFSLVHVVLCVSLRVSSHVIGYEDEAAAILPLVGQCVYIVVCASLGLSYMYVYRVVRSRINPSSNKSVGGGGGGGGGGGLGPGTVGGGGAAGGGGVGLGGHGMAGEPTLVALGTAITTTVATGLLFVLMGFVQLYGIFGVRERPQPYPWLWWGWEFSVRLIELSLCGLIAWVASLSRYPLREKHVQQHAAHGGFALFPCGSSTSTENMDDVLYPAICSTNQAIQNYTMRTGKQVYDDSFPLNALPERLNVTGTFERHSIRKSGTMGHLTHEGRGSLNRHGNGVQTLRSSETRARHTPVQGLHEQAPVSGSTMLVAEDGFVRFRSLGAEDDELSDGQSVVGTHGGRGGGGGSSSLAGSVRYSARQHPNLQHQHTHQHPHQYQHQHSLQHAHASAPTHSHHQGHHQSHHQLYNNT